MKHTYSLYEAKAKLSQIVREVRQHGRPVTISYHGEPVVEIRPIEPARSDEDRIEKRLRELEALGAVSRGNGEPLLLRPIAKRPGALKRFLEERD